MKTRNILQTKFIKSTYIALYTLKLLGGYQNEQSKTEPFSNGHFGRNGVLYIFFVKLAPPFSYMLFTTSL